MPPFLNIGFEGDITAPDLARTDSVSIITDGDASPKHVKTMITDCKGHPRVSEKAKINTTCNANGSFLEAISILKSPSSHMSSHERFCNTDVVTPSAFASAKATRIHTFPVDGRILHTPPASGKKRLLTNTTDIANGQITSKRSCNHIFLREFKIRDISFPLQQSIAMSI